MGLSSQLFARALGVETKRRFWMPSRQCHQKSSSGLFVVEAAALASVSQHAPLIIFPAKPLSLIPAAVFGFMLPLNLPTGIWCRSDSS
jgi:hypothetical protein